MIFADPPYFLSNGGMSVQSGRQVSVNKGGWDTSRGFESDNKFNLDWLAACRDKLTPDGTIWVSGTFHNIASVEQAMKALGMRILNLVTWQKMNPPPNLSCRFFTHSAEFVLWVRKSDKARHFFNYDLMRQMNGGRQMRDVWTLPSISRWEKTCGKHPTQKPLPLLVRILLASTREGDRVLDPFAGSSSTGVAANLLNRCYVGIDSDETYLNLSAARRRQLDDASVCSEYRSRIMSVLHTDATIHSAHDTIHR